MGSGKRCGAKCTETSEQMSDEQLGPDFRKDVGFWLYVWRSVNYSWERHWSERTEDTDAWWIGRHAGKMFRLRELSGFADSYFHGSLVTGSGKLTPHGRKFSETELENRKETQEWRRNHPINFRSPKEDLLKAENKKLQERVERLRAQISDLCSDGYSSFPTDEEIEKMYAHVDSGGESEGECTQLHLGDLTEDMEKAE